MYFSFCFDLPFVFEGIGFWGLSFFLFFGRRREIAGSGGGVCFGSIGEADGEISDEGCLGEASFAVLSGGCFFFSLDVLVSGFCFFLIGLLLMIRGFWKNAMMGDWDDLEIG